MNSQRMVFIIGCPRSGSSILGECMGQHQDVLYLGEQGQSLWNLDDQNIDPIWLDHHERDANILDRSQQIKTAVIGRLEHLIMETALTKGRRINSPIIVDKCPPNSLRISMLNALFPDALFINIIRDGRDVVCSLRPGLESGWNFLKPAHWQMIASQPESIRRAAMLWRYVVNRVETDLKPTKEQGRAIDIRYKDFVECPYYTCSRIRRLTDLPSNEDYTMSKWALENVSNATKEGYCPPSQAHWMRYDHKNRIGRYKENLTDSEAAQVYAMLNVELRKFGFEI